MNVVEHQRNTLRELMLRLIRAQPGIRPSELNRRLGVQHSATLRARLISQGLIRKVRIGSIVRYFPLER